MYKSAFVAIVLGFYFTMHYSAQNITQGEKSRCLVVFIIYFSKTEISVSSSTEKYSIINKINLQVTV